MSPNTMARSMPKAQRDLLIRHINGPRPLAIGPEIYTRNALVLRNLLRFDNPQNLRPRATLLTDLGRETVCIILGDYADALVRAGVLESVRPIVLKKLPKVEGPDLFGPVVATEQESAFAFAWRAELTAR